MSTLRLITPTSKKEGPEPSLISDFQQRALIDLMEEHQPRVAEWAGCLSRLEHFACEIFFRCRPIARQGKSDALELPKIGFFNRSQGEIAEMGLCPLTISHIRTSKCSGLSGTAADVSPISSNAALDQSYLPSTFVDLIETSE